MHTEARGWIALPTKPCCSMGRLMMPQSSLLNKAWMIDFHAVSSYGEGVYLTIDARNAAKYCGDGAQMCVIIARAVLGHPYLAPRNMPTQARPPLVDGHKAVSLLFGARNQRHETKRHETKRHRNGGIAIADKIASCLARRERQRDEGKVQEAHGQRQSEPRRWVPPQRGPKPPSAPASRTVLAAQSSRREVVWC